MKNPEKVINSSLLWTVFMEIQSSVRSRKDKDTKNHSTVKEKSGIKLRVY